jgi:CheY-like chemotaxis protein
MQLDLRPVDPPLEPLRIVETANRPAVGGEKLAANVASDNLHEKMGSPCRQLAVLLVTDDPTFADVAQRVLHGDNDLTVCGSLAECVRKLRLGQFDAVLANLRVDTFCVGDAVRQQCAWRRPFLIAFADDAAASSRDAASKEAFDLLLPRSFDAGALLAVLGRLRSFLASVDSFDPMI